MVDTSADTPNPFESKRDRDRRIPGPLRAVLVLGGIVGMTLLGTAFRLSPNKEGFGTHQQLGFPPCSFIQLFEIPCPSCGMTTSWSNLTKGNLIQAFQSNCGGALLGIAALILSPWFLVSGLKGKWWITEPDYVLCFYLLLGITIVTIVQWIIWISFFPI